jgi:hypothetical protein
MLAIVRQTPPEGRAEAVPPSANCRKPVTASPTGSLPKQRFTIPSTTMLMAQPTGTPQMLRDVGLARSVDGPHDA